MKFATTAILIVVLSGVWAAMASVGSAQTQAARTMMKKYLTETRQVKPGFQGFSAAVGKRLFFADHRAAKKPYTRSCTSCHTDDLNRKGRTRAGKVIEPLSPAANSDRFRETKKIKKWFRRNCEWVLNRVCTPEEKGHLLTFLFSLNN